MPSMPTMSAPPPDCRSRAIFVLSSSSSTPWASKVTVTSSPSSAIACSNSGITHSLIQFASASFFPPAIAFVTIVRAPSPPPPSPSPPPLHATRVREAIATLVTAPSAFFLLMVVLYDRSDGFWAGRRADAPRGRTGQPALHGRPAGRGPLSPRRHVRRCRDEHQSTTHMSGRQGLTSCQSRLVDGMRDDGAAELDRCDKSR